jgi:peptidoglycan/LPS O-acetylase OafA/YrhL
MRGLAAFAVLLCHIETRRFGHEAEMLFFVISGYCIAAAADSAQRRQLPLSLFMWRRLRRIYPPYFFSVLFFLFTRVARLLMNGSSGLDRFTPLEFIQNFTLTQWLTLTIHPQTLAADNPASFVTAYWSLNYEEQFYVCVGLCLLLCGRRSCAWAIPVVVLLMLSGLWNWSFHSLRTGFLLDLGTFRHRLSCLFSAGLCRLASRPRAHRRVDSGGGSSRCERHLQPRGQLGTGVVRGLRRRPDRAASLG